MNEQDYQHLCEMSWRRPLTGEEMARLKAHLADHPGAREEWENEAALNQLLQGLPAAPSVASNFTARVMQAVAREAGGTRRTVAWPVGWLGLGWRRRLVAACVVAGACLLGWQQYQLTLRTEMARQVADVARAITADQDLIQNFDPIRRLSDTAPAADTQLLVLMQ